eukprot:1159078-Pelagomonas_calceolata.AAC.4
MGALNTPLFWNLLHNMPFARPRSVQVVQAVTESAARAAAATSSGENSDAEGTELARHKFMDKQGLLPEEHSESVGLSSGHTKVNPYKGWPIPYIYALIVNFVPALYQAKVESLMYRHGIGQP